MNNTKTSEFYNSSFLFWILSFLFYSLITLLIFNHRIENVFTHYGMPDIDTDGGLWYQWYSIYVEQNQVLYYVTSKIVYPYGFDLTFLPFANLVYSTQILILQNVIGPTWSNLVFITNFSSFITYPISALGASLLAYYVTKNKWASLLTGLIFSFSFYHVHMARGQMSINHIEAIPIYILSLLYYLDKKTIFALTLSALIFAILFKVDAYYAFFSGIFSVVIVLFYRKDAYLQKVKTIFLYYPILLFILVVINLNFFITNYYLFNQQQAAATGRNSIPINELVNVLYYFIPQDYSLLSTYAWPLNIFIFILIPLIALSGLILLSGNRKYLTFTLCFLVAVFLSAYTPYSYWINELYFRYFGMFRGVSRMILPAYLFLGLMVSMAVLAFTQSKMYKKFDRKKIILAYLILVVLIILNSLNVDPTWLKTTDISIVAKLYEPIKKNRDIKVIATYPMTQNGKPIGCPETYQLIAQIIHQKSYACGSSPFQPETIAHYKKISNIESKGTIDYLITHNIDTIIISNKLYKNAVNVNKRLREDPRIAYVGRFTAPYDHGYMSVTDLSRDISVYQLKPVVARNNTSKPLIYSDSGALKVTYKKITPEKYIIEVDNLKQESYVIFDVPYSEKWKMYIGDYSRDNDFMFNFKEKRLYNNHKRYNGYANVWVINPDNIAKNFPEEVSKKGDNAIKATFTIYFLPQAMFYTGSFISNATLLILSLFLLINLFYAKRKK